MSGGKSRSTDHTLHVVGNDLFVANPVLHRADSTRFIEGMGHLRNCAPGMDGLGGNDAIVAMRNFIWIAGGIQSRRKVRSAGKAQAILAYSLDVVFPNIVSPDLDLAFPRKMRGEQAADGATTDDADSKQ